MTRDPFNDTEPGQDPDVLEAYEAAENSGLEPDTVDVPLPDIAEDIKTGSGPPDVDDMSPIDLLESVMRRGSVMFNEGRMLTACPGYDQPAVCGMYPLPHPSTGDPIMVCTGPVITKESKFSIWDWENKDYYTVKQPRYSCPFHPDRINESPENLGLRDSSGGSGWL